MNEIIQLMQLSLTHFKAYILIKLYYDDNNIILSRFQEMYIDRNSFQKRKNILFYCFLCLIVEYM